MKTLSIALGITVIVGMVGLYYLREHIREQRQEYYSSIAENAKKDVAITIIEGKRREEIAQLVDAAEICSAKEFLAASNNNEGQLFPDTYRFFPGTTCSTVVQTLVKNFQNKLAGKVPTRDQLILASIVEREAKTEAERPTIAGVYQNRLTIGMKLDADPTTQYGKETLQPPKDGKYWQPITQADYSGVNSPYNTYLKAGLPPGPIANPGLSSLRAAMNPAKHDYLYFQHKGGELLLSKGLEEHVGKSQ